MREIVHLQAGQCGNQIGAKVSLQLQSAQLLQDDCNLMFVRFNMINLISAGNFILIWQQRLPNRGISKILDTNRV